MCGITEKMSVDCKSVDFKKAECSCAAPPPTPVPGPIIGGYGEYRYQLMPELLQMPAGAEVQHSHGIEVDPSGNIYLTYVNWNNGIQTNGTDQHCLVRWNPDGTNGTFLNLGGTDLCNGTPHGLKIAKEEGGVYLYHANCGTKPPRYGSGKLTKTTLDGKIIWQHDGPFGQDAKAAADYRPTWWVAAPSPHSTVVITPPFSLPANRPCVRCLRWAIPPSGDYVYLADGYGSSNVYVFTRDGIFQNRSFGGKGKESGKFNNCHGMIYDPRTKQLVVSDRENHRFQIFDFDGTGTKFEYVSTITPTWGVNGTQRPCNFRVLENSTNTSINGMVVIADLGADDQSKPGVAKGQVAVLDQQNKLVSVSGLPVHSVVHISI
jgi:hypothetical protein